MAGKYASNPMMTPDQALRILAKSYGPVTWSARYDPVSELIFTVLSQHTSDINAERAYSNLRDTFGSWESVASGNLDTIASAIRIGGLSGIKAPRIKQLLNQLVKIRGSLDLSFLQDIPLAEAKTWLRQLPGVGPKTAAVVLCFALGRPAMPVDTHVYRVAKRLGLIDRLVNVDQAHDILEQAVHPNKVFAFHVYLITHGRRVCKAQNPLCQNCSLAQFCPSSRMAGGHAREVTIGRDKRKLGGRYRVQPEEWRATE